MKIDDLLIDDFENAQIDQYETNHTFVSSYQVFISTAYAKQGKQSLALNYDFSGWSHGNGAMYIRFVKAPATYKRPKRLGLWVKGDGHSPWMRAVLLDGAGMKKVINLTEAEIDWIGWKYVEAAIGEDWILPITLEQIYVVETEKQWQRDASYQGILYLDAIRYVYHDERDLVGPIFHDTVPEQKYSTLYSDSFNFSTKVSDDQSGVDPSSIQVFSNHKQLPHHFCPEKGLISYPFREVDTRQLCIVVKAKDYAGNPALPDLERVIEVDLSPDVDPPRLTELNIQRDKTIYTDRPRIAFRLLDEKSGVDPSLIHVYLNTVRLTVHMDLASGWCYSYPRQPIAEGLQTLTITASDKAGNQMETVILSFYHQKLELPMSTVKLAVIPDTHTKEAFSFVYKQVLQHRPDLVLHMGDMVDQATVEEFESIQRIKDPYEEVPFFAAAGNHEAFRGDLNLFYQYFGAAVYHFQFHETLLIVLNSAHDQSITKSDSTQFHYLRDLLAECKQSSIIVATHVPITDPLGTAHEMEMADAERLHDILSNYKQRNPNVQITVLFGHLHIFRSWIKDNIQYVIVGNGAQKGYTSHNNGNVLGFSQLEITGNKLQLQFIPLVTRICIDHDHHGRIQLAINERRQLTVHGLFQSFSPYYTIDLTEYRYIPFKWSSSNQEIVTVSSSGEITGRCQGIAFITVIMNDSKAEIEVEVVEG